MKWQAIYHPDVEKEDLPKIPKNLQARIKKAIELRLLQDPASSGEPLRKSLKGHRKLRVGNYRVIYRIEESTVFIFKIGHRKEVYRK
ncbi:MAG: type II toxin-antitoxin system RelE/ParE family toxin [bacterium (Candidatus Ratteibacteria) CG_4_10_14_3_um_filter_41_18]|uniref:Type II toxin-antitoxin system RelE/ParE family toxin n=3 Tax=Candidatus Ratteibacteria TaxID=2979319 RepID=A0A2M7E7I6_9BACT|nr:MAG: type II toxin-antitoxin system RelE/ParE family toxin [bacterium (Candidatus Ratteibacteria) CG01_land_8_20_14_3_00_40_19]PIW32571.1 MAG: type II toxin-antitoxin system RelE/ParE family toxin [bacterium (Candidatus Ratteibacteria) CG15_BIG_FIL_POST_REV_8_21_14_020_41_12]PIX77299.1 MAG: type II toxin-antitoxin system RelE/ParE family toxin [bacterium (Candidatus Ratteibacteria) CG_4_10_14_3_um_filter_41_18]HCG76959.1 type II toxin-antitoxin system RelE/ParE family toxin [bacterium]